MNSIQTIRDTTFKSYQDLPYHNKMTDKNEELNILYVDEVIPKPSDDR